MMTEKTSLITYLFFDHGLLSEKDLHLIYLLMPKDRQCRYDSYRFEKDKRLCASAYILLMYGISHQFGVVNARREFLYGENGKPSFADMQDVHFNISHCDKGVACVLGTEPAGIDIQDITDYDAVLAKNVMSQRELDIIENSTDRAETFTKFWVCKESYLKCIGTGIDDNLSACEFTELSSGHFSSHEHCLYLQRANECIICVCGKQSSGNVMQIVSVADLRLFIETAIKECVRK